MYDNIILLRMYLSNGIDGREKLDKHSRKTMFPCEREYFCQYSMLILNSYSLLFPYIEQPYLCLILLFAPLAVECREFHFERLFSSLSANDDDNNDHCWNDKVRNKKINEINTTQWRVKCTICRLFCLPLLLLFEMFGTYNFYRVWSSFFSVCNFFFHSTVNPKHVWRDTFMHTNATSNHVNTCLIAT